MPDRFTLSPFEFFVRQGRMRFPFRYGITSVSHVSHLLVRTTVTLAGETSAGLSSDGLPPKWFTKNPQTTFEEDLPEILKVIRHAATVAEEIARVPISFFNFWRELYRAQSIWADAEQIAPLLANLGVSLVERAALDGLCHVAGEPLHRMVGGNRLGLCLREIYSELGRAEPRELLPTAPLSGCFARHTIGLSDGLSLGDIPAGERVDDGLPQDLENSIREYGLRYFKFKLSADVERDLTRLEELAKVLRRGIAGEYFVTLDANENFGSFEVFRDFWRQASEAPALRELWPRVIVVEQPVHRDQALSDVTGAVLHNWSDRPQFIIDESDGAVGDLPKALALGYVGTSHKNCKGIVKGIANACLLESRRRNGEAAVLTGEDLGNVGPVALQSDFAMMALLGIEHVERNGHHYYRGLSMWPAEWQNAALAAHEDLYRRHREGFVCLRIREGRVALGSVNQAPFGVTPRFDPSRFERVPYFALPASAHADSPGLPDLGGPLD